MWPAILLWVYRWKGMRLVTTLCLSFALVFSLLEVHQLHCALQYTRLTVHDGETMSEQEALRAFGPPLAILKNAIGKEWIYTDGFVRGSVWVDLEGTGRVRTLPGYLFLD